MYRNYLKVMNCSTRNNWNRPAGGVSTFVAAALVGWALLAAGVAGGCNSPPAERGQSAGEDEALKRRLERRAAARPDKASATFGAIHHHADAVPVGGPVRVEVADKTVEIAGAYLVLSAMELHACLPGDPGYEPSGDPSLLNDLRDWITPVFIGRAHAHVPSSATRLGTPFVEDLLSPSDRARIIGEIAPPLAQWCTVAAVVAPADDDVLNTTDLSTEAAVGASLVVRGRWRHQRKDEGDGWRDFEWRTDTARAVEMPAVDPRSGQSPLVLDAPGDSVMLLIDKDVTPETFAVDPTAEDPAATVLKRLTDTFQIHQFDEK